MNASLKDGKKPSEATKGSAILSSTTFVEGHPFAATLWAGMEGFHMTVNGRHETSYLYREVRVPTMVPLAEENRDSLYLMLSLNFSET